jgi:tRNA threonylcarbamoyladenosine biosynthesis protein TsaB
VIKLFIDTSYDVFIGLLNSQGKWEGKTVLKGFKASQILQKEIYSLLQNKKFDVSDIDGVITSAGPGFYTGMRVSEGVADVFKLKGLSHYSYYNFMIPKWYGNTKGLWMTKAYRGEYFFYLWDGEKSEKFLLQESELASHFEAWNKLAVPYFIHQDSAIDEKLKNLIGDYQQTVLLIENNPEVLHQAVISNNLTEASYYFRAPEDEFRPSL